MSSAEIRIIFLYEFKLGHSVTEAFQNINSVYGEDTVSERTIFRWFEKFRSGDHDLNNKERGRPKTKLDNEKLKDLVEAGPSQTTRELGSQLGASAMTVSRHLKELGKTKKLEMWVPHELTEAQQLTRLETCSSLLLRNRNEPFLDRLVTCDEKWVLYDNRRRSGQWLDKNEKPQHMAKPNLHPKKVMITVWWSMAGLIHYSFLPAGQTITANSYCEELERFHEKLGKKQPALVNRKGPILLHDNARPHISRLTVQKLQELNIEVLPHPPYSPDLSPTDFYFFRCLDNFLRNKKIDNENALKSAFQDFASSLTPNFYRAGIEMLVSRWEKCIESEGSYFD